MQGNLIAKNFVIVYFEAHVQYVNYVCFLFNFNYKKINWKN